MVWRRRVTGGLAVLALGLLAPVIGGAIAPQSALAASDLSQCTNAPPPSDVGEAELSLTGSARKKLAKNRLSTLLIRPARWLAGVPAYPVKAATEDRGRVDARLRGGFVIRGGGRRLKVVLTRFQGGRSALIEGRLNGRRKTLFRVTGNVVTRKASGQVELEGGRVKVARALAGQLRRKVGIRKLRAGFNWGRLYLTWDEGAPYQTSTPDPPEPFAKPSDASDLEGATLTWRVRPSWIQYVESGFGSRAVRGAIPGTPEVIDGQPPLVYDFSFPFTSGWVEDGPDGVESASVKGWGGVYFRYCGSANIFKGINLILHSPEVEIDGPVARLIFRVEGIDRTPFKNTRAVVVVLKPVLTPSSDGVTSSWTAIPGAVPIGSLGIFGNFPGYAKEFGSVTLSIQRGGG